MEKQRVGLVGLAQGWYATLYSRHCAQRQDVRFVGICDLGESNDYVRACAETTADEFAQEIGTPLFHRFEDLMDTKPTALIVTNESGAHHSIAVPAIETGVHVFLGKPATITLSAAEQIAAASTLHPGVVVLPGEPARYEDGMIQAQSGVASGVIGKPLMTHIFVNHPAMTNHAWEMDPKRGGGPVIEFGCYVIDLAEWIVGSPIVSVAAMGANFLHPQIPTPDNVKMIAEHANGGFSSLDMCSSIHWTYPFLGLEVIGEKGSIRTDYHNYPTYIQTPEGCQVSEPRTSAMNLREIEHFMDCIQGKARPGITIQDYVSTMQVLEAVQEALASGRRVPVKRSEHA
ncbi:MAG: Gfo/Idh/MocA family oxidoreductase [Chloroflexi bacterium]|nr:Gfo/Idh/MocA family oxidoreductase [Chloroflexota bacterium]